jgi:hypothetical protein
MPRPNTGRSTDAVACRVPNRDADLIRRAAHERGLSVSAFLQELLSAPLTELRQTS